MIQKFIFELLSILLKKGEDFFLHVAPYLKTDLLLLLKTLHTSLLYQS